MHQRTLLMGLSAVVLTSSLAMAQATQTQQPRSGSAGQGATQSSGGSTTQGGGASTTASTRATQGGSTTAASAFIREAAQGGLAEVQLATLAEQKATSEEVKALARQIRQDHQQANQELQKLAATKNITLPSEPGAQHKAAYAKLEKATAQTFDQQYVDEMVRDHRADIAKFKAQSNASDREVAAFVNKTLPVLQAHLSHAEAAQATVKGKSGATTSPRSGAATTAPHGGTTTPRSGGSAPGGSSSGSQGGSQGSGAGSSPQR